MSQKLPNQRIFKAVEFWLELQTEFCKICTAVFAFLTKFWLQFFNDRSGIIDEFQRIPRYMQTMLIAESLLKETKQFWNS